MGGQGRAAPGVGPERGRAERLNIPGTKYSSQTTDSDRNMTSTPKMCAKYTPPARSSHEIQFLDFASGQSAVL